MQSMNASANFSKAEVQRTIEVLRRAITAVLPRGSFAEREQAALAVTNEAVRIVLQEDLQAIADGFGDEVEVNGVVYKRHEPATCQYHSLCGPLYVVRDTFRETGVHNGPTIVPLELAAGIVERATPELGRNVAHGYGEHDMRTHERQLHVAHRNPPPRATLERIASAIAAGAHEHAPFLERTLRRAERLPPEAHAVVVGFDRASVPMAEPRAAESPKITRRRRNKPYQRRPPQPIDVNWRMAYIGTVSIVDCNGEALVTRRYAGSPGEDETQLVNRMMEDVRLAVRRRASLRVAAMQDGAPEMWNRVREGLEGLRRQAVISRWHEGIDICHVIERLGDALELLGRDDRSHRLHEWKANLLSKSSAINEIESFLKFYRHRLSGDALEAFEQHLTYLENNKDRMDYAKLIRAGLPIASGVTEGAAKNVINMRTKRSGQRWREPGLRGVLTLRALLKSERLDAFWSLFSRRYVANVNTVCDAA